MQPAEPMILYDGVCGLCHRTVQFLIRRDRKRLRYAPLQGETARALRALYPDIPDTLESVVLIDRGRVYLRSKAFLYACNYLIFPWKLGYYGRWLPAFALDIFYNWIARIRYRVWGQLETCTVPTADDSSRLLP